MLNYFYCSLTQFSLHSLSITANNLSSCYVYLPDLDTQTVIVRLLKSYEEQLIIDRMIFKQHEKQKQYLLRQMFIQTSGGASIASVFDSILPIG